MPWAGKIKITYGAFALSTGVTVFDRSMLEKDDYEGIKELTKAHVDAIKK